jgi:hypothetical protein
LKVLTDGGTKVLDWKTDKRWSDKFLTEIKGALGVHLIGEPPVEEDTERNTDLMVLRMKAVRIAVRIRKNGYLHSYGSEFTIRVGRPSGIKTELTKVIEGWGDYFFYGFSDAEDCRLARWTLADLKVFRRTYNQMVLDSSPGMMPGTHKRNVDGSSSFVSFRWSEFPADLIVAHSDMVMA